MKRRSLITGTLFIPFLGVPRTKYQTTISEYFTKFFDGGQEVATFVPSHVYGGPYLNVYETSTTVPRIRKYVHIRLNNDLTIEQAAERIRRIHQVWEDL